MGRDIAAGTGVPHEDESKDARDEATRGEPTANTEFERPTFVVGLGASAGGLEALERFFQNVPLDTGWAFVVVQHLSPDFKSLMDELLARRTKLPIHRVEDGMAVAANSIYLIPAQKNMVLSGGKLLLTDQDKSDALKLPIDMFFRSLAQDLGPHAIGIVLSGTGSDGSRGVRELHKAGGLVVVQDKESAAFDGMPRSAADTGLADIVDCPERMPARIMRFIEDPAAAALEVDEPPEPENEMSVILGLLRNRCHIDFSVYKPSTVGRRIDRRINLARCQDIEAYIRRLHDDPSEVDALFRDILVEVTQFFRDSKAFHHLEQEVIPRLVEQARSQDGIRVWAPGCATGQEAYSLAILFRECMRQRKKSLDVKIFASDVHQQSLEVGSTGVYDERSVAGIRPRRLQRYFVNEGEKYSVTQELRQMVIFAPHDVTRDPPFTKLDLISCRNLLIYLLPSTQRKVLSLFHFALKTGGVLFLGPSETVADLEPEFEVVNSRWRIYRKRRDVRLLDTARLPGVPNITSVIQRRRGLNAVDGEQFAVQPIYEALLAEYVPSSLLLNENREILHSFGDARRYFQLPEGRSSLDVLKLTSGELRTALSAALHRAEKEERPVVYKGVQCQLPEGEHSLKITVKPLANQRAKLRHFLVCLEEMEEPRLEAPAAEDFNAREHEVARISNLEEELQRTKEHLQSTIEELETSNEELQSANEELVASNEELQSTNEELHSVNEELYTVNAEYQRKIEELSRLSNDMQNLLRSTEIGTVFLDRRLNIRRFTPAAAKTFNFLPRDIGRPISHIAHSIPLAEGEKLVDLVRQVLRSGRRLEREIRNATGSPLLMRIQPYITERDTTEGAVLTFVDVSVIKEAEQAVRDSEARFRQLADNIDEVFWLRDARTYDFVFVSPAYEAIWGRTRTTLYANAGEWTQAIHPDDRSRVIDELRAAERGAFDSTFRIVRQDGSIRWIRDQGFPVYDDDGHMIRIAGIAEDVTDTKEVEGQLRKAKEELEARVTARTTELASVNEELKNSLQREREQSERLRILTEAAMAVSTGRSVEETLEIITQRAREMAGVRQATTNFVVDSDWSRQRFATARAPGESDDVRPTVQPDGTGIFAIICQSNQAVRVSREELATHPLWKALSESPPWQPPEKNWLAVPLVGLDGKNVGLIQLTDKQAGEFNAEDEAILQQLARLAAAALEVRHARESLEHVVEQRTAELRRANNELRGQYDELRQFTDLASRDLQSPLDAIQSSGELLADALRDNLGDEAFASLHRIRMDAGRMRALIDDLLSLTRVGSCELRRQRFSLHDCVDRATAELEQPIRSTGASITRDDLPVVSADPHLLGQVFAHLLGNALKFVNTTPAIHVTAELADGQWVYGVRDNGIGIAADQFDRAFQPFQHVHNEDYVQGTGIGLAICQKAIQRHGGRIWIESTPGAGSHFRFTLD